jgi:squalene-hopene/tetraprenyl-beta-curcumene cyclase
MISKETMLDEPGAEAVLSLFTLATQRRDRNEPVTEPEKIALKNLLAIQQKDGGQNDGGGWTWFKNRLHPVESEEGAYFGSTLAAWALAAYPASATAQAMPALQAYLERESPRQPLHHRLAWVTFAPGIKQKDATLRELWTTQQSDGGFTSASLGPWSKQEKAAPDTGSNPYATAWAAFTAREAGVSCSAPGLKRALDWLERNQDPTTGAWPTQSMNKVHEKGSTQSKFMTDATTGFAAAALIGCKRDGIIQSTTVR